MLTAATDIQAHRTESMRVLMDAATPINSTWKGHMPIEYVLEEGR